MLDSEDFELSPAIKLQYLQRRRAELNRFKTMNEVQKIEFAQQIGHKIAGSARSFGFKNLEPVAREMEHLKLFEYEKCQILIDSFENILTRYC